MSLANHVSATAGPTVLPVPQELTADGVEVPLAGTVTVAVGAAVEQGSREALAAVIRQAGGTAVFTETGAGATVFLGTTADSPALVAALGEMGAESADGLAADGYVIATGTVGGQAAVVLNGKDATGVHYAVQTLAQLVTGGSVPAVTVRDWPLMSIRGGIEGFYGIPWSHQARLDQLEFYGRHKMNTYIYTPKDDSYLRAQWRELYPAAELALLRELLDAAAAHHVNFTFALSPGNDISYSSDADLAATLAKFEQLRAIGVNSFYIALDDIDPQLKSAEDLARFTNDGSRKLADAQAYYLNRVVSGYIKPHGLRPLQTVPTHYNGSAADPYKGQFGLMVDPSVLVQWTGEGIFSDEITEASVQAASASYNTGHLYLWDNFPVNDDENTRLFLNPVERRSPFLFKHIDGITSNPMVQPYASMIALAGFADYAWNGPAYDPTLTQAAIITELAGADASVRNALETFVDLNQDWKKYRPDSLAAPALCADVAAYWAAHASGNAAGKQPLQERLATIAALPQTLPAMAVAGFFDDAKPWIDAASHWALAVAAQLRGLDAATSGNPEQAAAELAESTRQQALAGRATAPDLVGFAVVEGRIVPAVGDGVFQALLATAFELCESLPAGTPGQAGARGVD